MSAQFTIASQIRELLRCSTTASRLPNDAIMAKIATIAEVLPLFYIDSTKSGTVVVFYEWKSCLFDFSCQGRTVGLYLQGGLVTVDAE